MQATIEMVHNTSATVDASCANSVEIMHIVLYHNALLTTQSGPVVLSHFYATRIDPHKCVFVCVYLLKCT